MRLRFGPHATRLAEQVLIRDPFYVVQILSEAPASVLADILRGLVTAFDSRPLTCACARCGRTAQGVCAYPASTRLIGFCERCVLTSAAARPAPMLRIDGYEAAIRHVASSFPRGHRAEMRRIVGALALCKGGPARATEAGVMSFLHPASQPASRGGYNL